ncbi:DUF2332 family protein [Rhodophyticola sp. CCM32]|uniref:DUF2332 domain-containing protein n=1 Tax=Rhodophyticola sp. CCM32 TaxID=2916397 RepID=UPI00107EEBD1|nr:DUF2332 family protein [Rhodophyticola sp. CCM32]QBX99699.1 DUF2332 family protein [Rhodophyticola sp. CCM32]
MTDALRQAFHFQAKSCEMLGSPFMGRLMTLFAERLSPGSAVADRLLGWPGDVGPAAQSVPLRIAGSLHGLVLDGSDTGLAAVYPPNTASDTDLWAGILRVFEHHEARLMDWLDLPPQTNEVRRSVALIPAALHLTDRFGLPLTISELGASAGLNLGFDRYGLMIGDEMRGPAESPVCLAPDWSGALPPDLPLQVTGRAGVDLNPLDVTRPDQALRLLAYLWPDQPDRLRLTRAAMELADTKPDTGDAAGWLKQRLATPHPGTTHLIYHTIAWQYFPPETQSACTEALESAGQTATPDAPLAHFSMEADGRAKGAALTLKIWPDGTEIPAGRVDFHGRWIDWQL